MIPSGETPVLATRPTPATGLTAPDGRGRVDEREHGAGPLLTHAGRPTSPDLVQDSPGPASLPTRVAALSLVPVYDAHTAAVSAFRSVVACAGSR